LQSAAGSTPVLQALGTHVIEGDTDLAADLTLRVVGDANAARLRDSLKAHRDIHCITQDVVFVDDYIADVNADAELDPLILRHIDILFGHAAAAPACLLRRSLLSGKSRDIRRQNSRQSPLYGLAAQDAPRGSGS
jgi:hypothetical protein